MMKNPNKHMIAAAFALLFAGGVWAADMIYDAANTVAIDKCGTGNVHQVNNNGLFSTEVICLKDTYEIKKGEAL